MFILIFPQLSFHILILDFFFFFMVNFFGVSFSAIFSSFLSCCWRFTYKVISAFPTVSAAVVSSLPLVVYPLIEASLFILFSVSIAMIFIILLHMLPAYIIVSLNIMHCIFIISLETETRKYN